MKEKQFKIVCDDNNELDVSDGYHTFNELYEHRIELFICLCRAFTYYADKCDDAKFCQKYFTWKSKYHSDGSKYDGWFVLGLNKENGKQITYHIPMNRWAECKFAETLEKSPDYDGHTSEDVLHRLKNL